MRFPIPLLVIALLGTGCVTTPDAATTLSAEGESNQPWQRVYVFDGERGPTDAPLRIPFTVDVGGNVVEALLGWTAPGAQFGFQLLDPTGESVASGWQEAEGRAFVSTTQPVIPGEWTLEISSARAVGAGYAATVTVMSEIMPYGPIDTTFVIPARNPTRDIPAEVRGNVPAFLPRDYAEVNLNMVPGDGFTFNWTSSSEVYFNVHFHGADGTERPIEERSSGLAGNFTAPDTEVYALLWRNEGNSDVEVRLELDGNYRLHSMTRRA